MANPNAHDKGRDRPELLEKIQRVLLEEFELLSLRG